MMPAQSNVIFQSARVFDGESEKLRERINVRVSGGIIGEISDRPPATGESVEIVDCTGCVLMPGLIDAHVHVYASSVNISQVARAPHSYLAHFAARFLEATLDRGFTTLRDVAGGDAGLARALKEGLIDRAPRLFYGGRAISQTGGHGDFRPGDQALDNELYCGCLCHVDALAVIADGVDAVRRAAREELRRGASHLKIMGSGGIASPNDPLGHCQYSDEEIRAVVDEATRVGSYVAAHCHPAEAVRRSAALGVRSIEHATLIDADTAGFVAERGAFTVPTMAVLFGLMEEGEQLGFPPVSMDKLRRVMDHTLKGLEIMKHAGVKMGFGTDLLGSLHVRQSTEFTLRARALQPIDVLRSACSINAELLGQSGRLGCIRPGAAADLLVVDGDPLQDISVLASSGRHLRVIMKDGRFYKRA